MLDVNFQSPSILYRYGNSPSLRFILNRITDCADLNDEVEEFGSIVDGLRRTLECITTDPVSDCVLTDSSEGARGTLNKPGLRCWCEGAVWTVCGLGVSSMLLKLSVYDDVDGWRCSIGVP
jgi:hypothetical protein